MTFSFSRIPTDYYTPVTDGGRLETFAYRFRETEKNAVVYLPRGYDADGGARYDILYLMHGGGGSEYDYMGRPDVPNALKSIVDHMVADGVIKPLIVVMPSMNTENMDAATVNAGGFHVELAEALMPALESRFRTYAVSPTPEGFAASRRHRAFGGFSMGSVATWAVLANRLDYFTAVMPMSGDSWVICRLGGSADPEGTAKYFEDAVKGQGFAPDEYRIFAATGKNDVAYPNLTPQIEAMKKSVGAFVYTETGFGDGNLAYYVSETNYHSYQDTYEYIFNGLKYLF